MVPLCQFSVGLRRGRLLTGLGWWLIAVIWKLSSSHVGLWKKCHTALATNFCDAFSLGPQSGCSRGTPRTSMLA